MLTPFAYATSAGWVHAALQYPPSAQQVKGVLVTNSAWELVYAHACQVVGGCTWLLWHGRPRT